MNRRLALIALLAATLAGCVTEDVPLDYARRAHPECSEFSVTAHQLSKIASSEVEMACPGPDGDSRVTVAVKCTFGFGILADTVCHENN